LFSCSLYLFISYPIQFDPTYVLRGEDGVALQWNFCNFPSPPPIAQLIIKLLWLCVCVWVLIRSISQNISNHQCQNQNHYHYHVSNVSCSHAFYFSDTKYIYFFASNINSRLANWRRLNNMLCRCYNFFVVIRISTIFAFGTHFMYQSWMKIRILMKACSGIWMMTCVKCTQ
jgi:hypothetical protein